MRNSWLTVEKNLLFAKANFSDFFEENGADERNYSSGLKYSLPVRYINNKPSTTFDARAFYVLSDSTNDAKDVEIAQMRVDWANPIRNWGKFSFQGTLARRWFQNVNPTEGYKERTDDWGMSAGIDFAPIVRRWINEKGDNPLIQKVRVGAGYFERNSNIDTNDNDGTLTPVVNIVIGRKL